MISTMFLPREEYDLYRMWLRSQDPETLKLYFGVTATQGFVDYIMDRILSNPDQHHFLIAFDHRKWVGVVHIADVPGLGAEFGFIVDPEHRRRGIGDRLMDEATTWCRNRNYQNLYLHCLSWNEPIKRLCDKHGLEIQKNDGDSDARIKLPPPSIFTVGKEIATMQRTVWGLMLNKTRIGEL